MPRSPSVDLSSAIVHDIRAARTPISRRRAGLLVAGTSPHADTAKRLVGASATYLMRRRLANDLALLPADGLGCRSS